MATVQECEFWNLNDNKHLTALRKLHKLYRDDPRQFGKDEQFQELCKFGLGQFALTGEYIMEHDGQVVVFNSSTMSMFKIQNGAVRCFGFGLGHLKKLPNDGGYTYYRYSGVTPEKLAAKPPAAVIVPFDGTKLTPKTVECAHPLILNGDQEGEYPMETLVGDPSLEKFEFPTISFQCMIRLLNLLNTKTSTAFDQLTKLLGEGTVEVLDYTPDKRIQLTAKQKEQHKRNKLVPPAGMTVVYHGGKTGYMFHRSATVVLRDNRWEPSPHYLLGSDEETYFGCELKGSPKTVQEAFDNLTPDKARVAGTLRQGEWFMVPIAADEAPTLEQCIAIFDKCGWEDCSVALPITDPDSNRHCISSEDGRIAEDGIFAKAPMMTHEQHEEVCGNRGQWYTFVRNTAVRSVSIGGVD